MIRKAVCTATVFIEVKFSTKAYHVRCEQGVSTSQKEASMFKLSVSRKIENISVPGQPHSPGLLPRDFSSELERKSTSEQNFVSLGSTHIGLKPELLLELAPF